jgi:hypothetical protein
MNQPKTINQPWLSLVRLVWIFLALYNVLGGLLNLPNYYHQLIMLNPWPNTQGWTQATFSMAVDHTGLAQLAVAWIVLVPALVKILVFLSLGLLIFWRKSNEWLGLLVSFVLVGLCGTFTGPRFLFLDALPPVWKVVADEAGALFWLTFFMCMILFPEGRFSPSWMRWVALSLGISFIAVEASKFIFGQTPDLIFATLIVVLVLILIGKVYHFRHLSNPVERQQIRWFLFAITVFIVVAILQSVFESVFQISYQPGAFELVSYLAGIYLSSFVILMIPASIAIAIFRYRLWDIDLIIRRTLQYGLMTLLLGLVYFGMVVLLGQVFRALTGQDSPLVVVLSTLLIAALFTPLRRRIQAFIDRRFFRQKYDTDQAVASFSAAARSQVELDALAGQLAAVAQESLQPQSVSLWLKKQESNR